MDFVHACVRALRATFLDSAAEGGRASRNFFVTDSFPPSRKSSSGSSFESSCACAAFSVIVQGGRLSSFAIDVLGA